MKLVAFFFYIDSALDSLKRSTHTLSPTSPFFAHVGTQDYFDPLFWSLAESAPVSIYSETPLIRTDGTGKFCP